jgi:hypothetical protein
MGSGVTAVSARFRPEQQGPDFDLNVRIENPDMKAMNDLVRAHAKFDVVSGVFSELHVKNGRVDGYVKPLFRDRGTARQAQGRVGGGRRPRA